jgi:hypothetical protein
MTSTPPPSPDLLARIARLEVLTCGLRRESLLIRQGNDPLLYLERQGYLSALDAAVHGLESARVVLARAMLRLREK